MDNDTQQGKSDLYYKACSAAVSLIDATSNLLQAQNLVQSSIENNSAPQLLEDLLKLIQQYEQVFMITNVIRSVQGFLESSIQRDSLENAANSASSTSYAVLLKFYQSLYAHPNNEVRELVGSRLLNLMRTNENFKTSQVEPALTPTPTPITQEVNQLAYPPHRKEPSSQQPPVQQKEIVQHEQPVEAEAMDIEPTPVQVVDTHRKLRRVEPTLVATMDVDSERVRRVEGPEYVETEPVQDTPVQEEAPVISTSQFLKGFENTAIEFSNKTGMHIDGVWESMFPYAVPANRLEWVKANMFQKKLSWSDAQRIYLAQYPDGDVSSPLPTHLLSKGKNLTPYVHIPEKDVQRSRQRVSDYAERFLSLEMKAAEDIDAYNEKYLRYCRAAQIDVHESSLQRRYLTSLLPKYRTLVNYAIQAPVQGLEELMHIASSTIKATEDPKTMTHIRPYTLSCEHNAQQKSQLNYIDKTLKRTYPFALESSQSKKVTS